MIRTPTLPECKRLSGVVAQVIRDIPYYNDIAKASEIDKYTEVELQNRLQSDPQGCLIAETDGQIAGFCFTHLDDGLTWIEWFGVGVSFRGRSIGDCLLEAAEAIARKQKCHKIWCDTRTENVTSIFVLERRGYERITTVVDHWYRQDFYLWQKRL